MNYITFDRLVSLRGKSISNTIPIDCVSVNLNNKYHSNLYDPQITVLEEKNCIVSTNFFLKTEDDLLVEDIGYREKVPDIELFQLSNITENIKETCFLLGGDTNYYHWLLNWLPRMFLYESLNLDCKIIVNKNFSSNQMQVFGALFPKHISKLYKIKGYTKFEKLILPNFFLNPLHSPFAVRNLRNRVFNFNSDSISKQLFSENIIISRKRAGKRRITNEVDLYNSLKDKGFSLYILEEMSFLDQVNLFYYCKKIIAPHGAGLANLLFCNNRPEVVEIMNEHYTKVFWSLGYLCGAKRYDMYRGKVVPNEDIDVVHKDIEVEVSFFQ